MRFRIRVECDTTTNTWIAQIHEGDLPLRKRELPCVSHAGRRWPLLDSLPADDRVSCSPAQQDVAQLGEILTRIRRNELLENDTRDLGGYLFDTLIGLHAWKAITERAQAGTGGFIELALDFSRAASDLAALNWELMRGPHPDGFLAAGDKNVAITRLVRGTTGAGWLPPDRLASPPRVLFVVGTSLTRAEIRPAVECLALLHQLRDDRGSLQSLVLEEASPRRLKALLSSFRPDVLHFIGHAHLDGNTPKLEMQKDDPPRNLRGDSKQLVSAEELRLYFTEAGVKPALVVLSACDTAARIWGALDAETFASQLVREAGIPAVIGMAGEVSDLACRLFSRRFGQALLHGEPLVRATMQGRWTASTEGDGLKSVHWALPAVFLAEAVRPDWAPAQPPPAAEGLPSVTARVGTYEVRRNPVFCGRDDCFRAYQELLHPERWPGPFSVLGIFTEQPSAGLGRTRVLFELTAHAVRDGHIPCLVGSDNPRWEAPKNWKDFAKAMQKAIEVARRALRLPLADGPLQLLSRSSLRSPEELHAYPEVATQLRDDEGQVTGGVIRRALEVELPRLAQDAGEKYRTLNGRAPRVLVLLDDLHLYPTELLDGLFRASPPDVLLTEFGLGTSEDWVVPVITAFAAEADVLKGFVPRSPRPWFWPLPLRPFREDDEDLLAYGRILLHPHLKQEHSQPDSGDTDWDRVTRSAWTINWQAEPDAFARFKKRLRQRLQGTPEKYASDEVYFIVEDFHRTERKASCVLAADDERALSEMLRRWPELRRSDR